LNPGPDPDPDPNPETQFSQVLKTSSKYFPVKNGLAYCDGAFVTIK